MEGVVASLLVLLILISAGIGMVTGDFLWLPRKLLRWFTGLPLRGLRAISKTLLKWGRDLRKAKVHGAQRCAYWLLSAPLSLVGFIIEIPADIFRGTQK